MDNRQDAGGFTLNGRRYSVFLWFDPETRKIEIVEVVFGMVVICRFTLAEFDVSNPLHRIALTVAYEAFEAARADELIESNWPEQPWPAYVRNAMRVPGHG